jgi:hypothetical protein
MKVAKTIAQVNRAIQKVYPELCLFKGEGCFFLYSDDPKTSESLAMWQSTTIYTRHLNHCSIEEWVNAVRYLAEDENNTEGYSINHTETL